MRVLVAEDDRLTLRILEKKLSSWGYEPVGVENGEEAWKRLQEERDLRFVLTDWMMPRMNGLELIQRIRASEHHRNSYVILLTAKGEIQEIVEGLSKGADDYITKPFDAEELAVRVRVGQRILRLQEELERMAKTDPLTGLYNRWGLREAVAERFPAENRDPVAVSFLLADIDHFKHINDTYGHDAGDSVLREFARRLKDSAGPASIVSRIGGEEFFLVIPHTERRETESLAERTRKNIADRPFSLPEGKEIRVTCSIGACWDRFSGPCPLERYMTHTDRALYQAKEGGRNRVVLYGSSLPATPPTHG